MEVFSVVAYIGLVCGQVGGVGFLPAPVLDLPLVRYWVVGALAAKHFHTSDPDDDDDDRDGHRNVGTILTPNAADSPKRLHQVHSPRKHQDQNIVIISSFLHLCYSVHAFEMYSGLDIFRHAKSS
jgi:hypothetical protein